MTSNILVVIKNLATQPIISIKSHYSGRNRVNGVGDALEKYVKEFYCIMKKEKFDSFPQKTNRAYSIWLIIQIYLLTIYKSETQTIL